MRWSPQQDEALRLVDRWRRSATAPQFFYLAGYAGTGKTTLARHFAESVEGTTLFAAYTGKAAQVLREAGCDTAQTLHSLLYRPNEHDRTKLERLVRERDELLVLGGDTEELDADIRAEKRLLRQPRFSRHDASPIATAELLVLDECSMVNEHMASDILSYGKKVLVLGDPAQLPPVKGEGYFTSRAPHHLLTEIHRQARDNPIIHFATLVREGHVVPFGNAGAARKLRREAVGMDALARGDAQLLVGKNATRRKLNAAVRKLRGLTGVFPQEGDRLVCLRNDRALGVLNGVVCHAAADGDPVLDEGVVVLQLDYEGRRITEVDACAEHFLAMDEAREPDEDVLWQHRWSPQFDFGYALTVHKAQGSQWDAVRIVDDGFAKRDPLQRRRWLYTAITRAKRDLEIIA